jgi:hypothetical protein
MHQVKIFIQKYSEAGLWTGSLILLFFLNPYGNGVSLCLLKNAGVNWCPGCGLGHSIHHALHLHFRESLQEHILGIPAVLILMYQIFKTIFVTNKKIIYGTAKNFNDVPRHGFGRTV